MNRLFKTLVSIALCQAATAAQLPASGNESFSITEETSFDTEVSTPNVETKQKAYIKAYMKQIAEELYREEFNIETMRNGEVVIAIIPTEHLFVQNEATLLDNAPKTLDRFKRFLKGDKRFKIILAVHSDNTGSEEYLYELTENRILSILDYYDRTGTATENIVGFPKGGSEPTATNDTRTGRAANRRLEIFIIPDERLIEEARTTRK